MNSIRMSFRSLNFIIYEFMFSFFFCRTNHRRDLPFFGPIFFSSSEEARVSHWASRMPLTRSLFALFVGRRIAPVLVVVTDHRWNGKKIWSCKLDCTKHPPPVPGIALSSSCLLTDLGSSKSYQIYLEIKNQHDLADFFCLPLMPGIRHRWPKQRENTVQPSSAGPALTSQVDVSVGNPVESTDQSLKFFEENAFRNAVISVSPDFRSVTKCHSPTDESCPKWTSVDQMQLWPVMHWGPQVTANDPFSEAPEWTVWQVECFQCKADAPAESSLSAESPVSEASLCES